MRNLFFATLLAAMASSRLAFAHIELQSPTARFVQNDNGLKTAPCGSGTPTGVVTPLVAGQTLTVHWKESVSHSGHYRIALSAHDSDFVEPTSLTIPTMLPPWDLADGIPDKTGTQTYTQDVRIPSTPCAACILQLLQVMGAGTDGTNSGPFAGVYHACADVTISAGATDAGAATDAATSIDLKLPADAPADEPRAPADTSTGAGGGATGTGGSVGSGGTYGTGGMGTGGTSSMASTGGTSGAGHGGSAGSGGTSVSNMTGGTTGAAGGSSSTGTGGTMAAGAGGNGGNVAAGGAPGHGGTTSGTNSGSSGCQMGARAGATWPALVLIAALLFVSRWRRRRFGQLSNGAMRSPSWTSSNCDTVAIPTKPRPASTRRTARSR